MTPPLERIRVSRQAREQLIKLKRVTGLQHWNTICRWAFCVSLSDPTPPANTRIALDSNVEMSWRTFGGRDEAVFHGLLLLRCQQDGLGSDQEVVASQFLLHLHRGIAYLAGNSEISSIESLLSLATQDQGGLSCELTDLPQDKYLVYEAPATAAS